MIKVTVGDLFGSQAQTLVNTVNCVGVMGKGVALGFKERFPEMYADYVERCKAGQIGLGRPYLFRRLVPPWILNFPTKEHWRSVSRLQDIIDGLCYLEAHYKEWGITSLAVPPLGCGQGQLEWRVVGRTLYRYLRRLDIPVELFAPHGTPSEQVEPAFLDQTIPELKDTSSGVAAPRIPPAWVAVVEILSRLEKEPYHWPVGRTTFQKIAYFATESGLPTGLRFQRGSFGPYSPELKSRITSLTNNGLLLEQRLGRMFSVRVGRTHLDARRTYTEQLAKWADIIEKVADLFMRMNTQQAEVAATVHFTANELKQKPGAVLSEDDVLRAVMQWKQKRRPPLDSREVAVSVRNLNLLSWIGARVSEDLPIGDGELREA